jgi:NhaP-type Na+/H+ or K+/H+ antiporter
MDESQYILAVLASLFVLGVGAQWIAWKLNIPPLLLLLSVGSLAGSITGWIEPDKVFGEMLLPMVSLAVGLILFEGGLNLNFRELHEIWRGLLGLLTIGVFVTWVGATLAGILILQLPPPVALVLGAVLTVTGPTVIGPLLRDIRPSGKVGAIAKWEGIIIDPIGATLTLLVVEALSSIRQAEFSSATLNAVHGLFNVLFIGFALGAAAAWIFIVMLKKFWIPDYLQNPMALMFVVAAFAGADILQHEAGLLAVTVMGIILANQKQVEIHRVIEFKENLTVLLITLLFILLSARVPWQSLVSLGWRGPLFGLVMILLVRPISVWLSTLNSTLSLSERLFLCWLAPRGIVAAAVSSVFALRLGDEGAAIAPATFIVIFMTVATYGLTSGKLARYLGLSSRDAQGVLIGGSNLISRALASVLKKEGFKVVLVDTSYFSISKARDLGLECCYANILSDHVMDEIDFGDIGRFMAMTKNSEVNTLAVARFRSMFGGEKIYQLADVEKSTLRLGKEWESKLSGRMLFTSSLTYSFLEHALQNGAAIKVTKLTETFDYAAYQKHYGGEAWPLFIIDGKKLQVVSPSVKMSPQKGQSLISLIMKNEPAVSESAATRLEIEKSEFKKA